MKLTWRHWVNPQGGSMTGYYHEFRSWPVYAAYYHRQCAEVNDPEIMQQKRNENLRRDLRSFGVNQWPIDWNKEYPYNGNAKYSNGERIKVGDKICCRVAARLYSAGDSWAVFRVENEMEITSLFLIHKRAVSIEKVSES